jgi:hypothetical protein
VKWNSYTTKILADLDNEAFFMSELKNINRRGDEIKASCPFSDLHESGTDNTPSLTVNVTRGLYYCQTCHSKGNAHTLYKTLYGLNNEEAWFQLGDALKIERPDSSKPTRPDLDVGLVGHYHQELMKLTGPIREVLRDKRGFTDETIKNFQLGWDNERITIPIYDEFNTLVNFRRYKWNSDNDQWKVLNYKDDLGNTYGEVRIFGIENLVEPSKDFVVWCEGETDRIIAEQNGIPACCATSGAGSWRPEWAKHFRTIKKVYIAQDNDEAGRIATAKLCEKLHRVCEVYTINWPEDFPLKGDITDFFVKGKQTGEDFKKLLESSTKYLSEDNDIVDTEAIEVSLSESGNSEFVGKKLKVAVMVSGKDLTPYICPSNIQAYCGDNADSENKKCYNCGLLRNAGEINTKLSAVDPEVLKLIKCSDKTQEATIKDMLKINKKCLDCKITIKDTVNIEELRLIPKAEANFGFQKEAEYVVRTGYFVGSKLKTNKRYTLVGYMYPDPNTQYATTVFEKAFPDKDIIDDFEMNDEVYQQLKVFQASGSIEEKMNEIQMDFERNVTYIWERRDVGIAVDLIYHTALHFYFQEQFVQRGWGELLIIGDSGQAKTTLVNRIMQHYRLGELHSGESSKRTGLIYNMQQTGGRWILIWGALPLNDGGLVTIDELSGMDDEELSKMSDVRSSGIAKASGVITSETTARTRAIYISNPRNGKPLNTEAYGANAILKLFGKAEDVRRLDLAMAVASGDVAPELVNVSVSEMERVPHVYTSDLCNMRTIWAWSRTSEQINITPDATKKILELATLMGKKYSARVPIVEAADQRLKIARLAIACACCVFSTKDGHTVDVLPEHAEYVVNFMEKIYSTKAMGYDKMSEVDNLISDESDENINDLRSKFLLIPTHDHNDLAETLYSLPYFGRNTLVDYTGLPQEEMRVLMKFLTSNNLIENFRGNYSRRPIATRLFESILENPITKEEVDSVRKGYYSNDY